MTRGTDTQKGSTDPSTGPAQDLRRRAEEKARVLGPEELGALSPAEAGRRVHELRVYQIELEMQNEGFYRELWESISGGRTWLGRMVNKRKDDSLYTEDATITPVCDAAGRVVNYVAVTRSISDWRPSSSRPRRWNRWGGWPAVWPTTSTTCST